MYITIWEGNGVGVTIAFRDSENSTFSIYESGEEGDATNIEWLGGKGDMLSSSV